MNIICFSVLWAYVLLLRGNGANFILSRFNLAESADRHALGVYDNALTVLKGNGYGYSARLDPYDGDWNKTTVSSPKNIDYFLTQSVQVNESVYIINPQVSGGTAINGVEMFIYDLVLNTYSQGIAPPTNGMYGCAVYNIMDNVIYYIGGYQSLTNTQSYDMSSDTWSQKAPINTARYNSGCAMGGSSSVYIFGGSGNNGMLDSIEKYNVSSDEWTWLIGISLSTAVYYHSCRLYPNDNLIYCMGGWSLSGSKNSVDIFDPSSDSMVGIIYMKYRRYYHETIVVGSDCLYVIGGNGGPAGDATNGALDTVEYLGNCRVATDQPTSAPSQSTAAPTSVTALPTRNTQTPTRVTSEPTSTPSALTSAPTSLTSAPSPLTSGPTQATIQPTISTTENVVNNIDESSDLLKYINMQFFCSVIALFLTFLM